MRVFDDPQNHDLVKRAYQAWDAEDWQQAGDLLETALRRDPNCYGNEKLWFDAALAYKFIRDWPKAYELGKQAAARAARGVQDPAFWNLGIAATVLRDWATARDSWSGYGIDLPPGDGEISADLGATCVRIATRTGQEVVWARRLCPARALLLSVPFDPARRFGEVVLHDGAPNGERIVQGTPIPVFDELMLFAPSEVATLSVTITGAVAGDVEALLELLGANDLGAEALSSGQSLCRCCSEASQTVESSVEAGRQTVLIAAAEHRASELLEQWRSARPHDRQWNGLHAAI